MVGDYTGALLAMHDRQSGRVISGEKRAMNEKTATDVIANHNPAPALATIVKEAAGRQIVILNEGHHVPRHRAFAQQLAIELRKSGFEFLACVGLLWRADEPRRNWLPNKRNGFLHSRTTFCGLCPPQRENWLQNCGL